MNEDFKMGIVPIVSHPCAEVGLLLQRLGVLSATQPTPHCPAIVCRTGDLRDLDIKNDLGHVLIV